MFQLQMQLSGEEEGEKIEINLNLFFRQVNAVNNYNGEKIFKRNFHKYHSLTL